MWDQYDEKWSKITIWHLDLFWTCWHLRSDLSFDLFFFGASDSSGSCMEQNSHLKPVQSNPYGGWTACFMGLTGLVRLGFILSSFTTSRLANNNPSTISSGVKQLSHISCIMIFCSHKWLVNGFSSHFFAPAEKKTTCSAARSAKPPATSLRANKELILVEFCVKHPIRSTEKAGKKWGWKHRCLSEASHVEISTWFLTLFVVKSDVKLGGCIQLGPEPYAFNVKTALGVNCGSYSRNLKATISNYNYNRNKNEKTSPNCFTWYQLSWLKNQTYRISWHRSPNLPTPEDSQAENPTTLPAENLIYLRPPGCSSLRQFSSKTLGHPPR